MSQKPMIINDIHDRESVSGDRRSFIAGGSAGFLGGLVQKEENEKKGILRVCSSMLKSSLIQ